MTEPLLPPIPEGLKVLRNAHGYNHYFTHLQMDKYGRDCANAAIEWHIAQQAQPDPLVCDDWVICPQCCSQFRAIPVNVQRLMLDAGFEPPFTQAAPTKEPKV